MAQGRVFSVDNLRGSVGYLRLKPDTSCRLTVIATSDGKGERPPRGFLLHLYPDADRARTAYDKVSKRESVIGEDGLEPFLSLDPPVVAAPFPNDPELPSLRHVYDPTRFRRALSMTRPPTHPAEEWRLQKRHLRTELLAYKPGRRAVFRVRAGVRHKSRDEKLRLFWHVQAGRPETAGDHERIGREIHAAVGESRDWRVPAPWGFLPERSWSSTEWVQGAHLGDDLEHHRRVGAALAELHGLSVELPPVPTVEFAEDSLASLASDLAALLPPEEARVRELARRLAVVGAGWGDAPRSVVHGDFHRDQVVMEDERVVLVDFDRGGVGLPALDLGAFLASRFEQQRDEQEDAALLDGYAAVRPHGELADIARATALQLFRRSPFPFRTLRPDWPTETARLLERVERLLAL